MFYLRNHTEISHIQAAVIVGDKMYFEGDPTPRTCGKYSFSSKNMTYANQLCVGPSYFNYHRPLLYCACAVDVFPVHVCRRITCGEAVGCHVSAVAEFRAWFYYLLPAFAILSISFSPSYLFFNRRMSENDDIEVDSDVCLFVSSRSS